jgi:leishmanolysin
MKTIFKFLIVVNIVLLARTFDFTCKHDEYQKKVEIKKLNLGENHSRFLQSAQWESIRIYVDYTKLDSQSTVVSASLRSNLKELTNNTVDVLQKLVRVKRLTSPLIITECYKDIGSSIGEDVKVGGKEADLILFPYFDLEAGEYLEAIAATCKVDSYTNRPLAGFIAFGQNLDFTKRNALYNRTLLMLHELFHVLGFNYELFPYFLDSDGNTIGKDNIILTKTVNGKQVELFMGPKVVETARKHFGCNTMEGLELEDQGGDLTKGSHWESRIMYSDFMKARTNTEDVISEMSLALLEDSGWYKVNYYTGGFFRYGKNQGCDFINSKCVRDGKSISKNDFPLIENTYVCFAGRTAKGIPSIQEYNSVISESFQYFENTYLGGDDIADYCPVATAADLEGWYDAGSCLNGISQYENGLGETVGYSSACFYSSLTSNKDTNLVNFQGKTRAICHEYLCDYETKTYSVSILDKSFSCDKDGGPISVDGFSGKFWCADFNLVCTKSVECNDVIDCINKQSLNAGLDYDYTPEDSVDFSEDNNGSSILIYYTYLTLIAIMMLFE